MKSLFDFILEEDQAHLKYRFKKKYEELYNSISHNVTPKHKTLVISMCGATKNIKGKKEKIPAREMFMGPANQTLLKVLPDLDVDWIILSGGYGLMNQTTKINYYTDVIMDLSDTELKNLRDFCKYQEDLIKVLKKGNYNRIIFTISDTWMIMLNMKEISEVVGDKCELIGFLSDKRMNDKDFEIPDNFKNIKINQSNLKQFGAGMIYIKEKITSEYLKYLQDHEDISMEKFIEKYKKPEEPDED